MRPRPFPVPPLRSSICGSCTCGTSDAKVFPGSPLFFHPARRTLKHEIPRARGEFVILTATSATATLSSPQALDPRGCRLEPRACSPPASLQAPGGRCSSVDPCAYFLVGRSRVRGYAAPPPFHHPPLSQHPLRPLACALRPSARCLEAVVCCRAVAVMLGGVKFSVGREIAACAGGVWLVVGGGWRWLEGR